MASLLSTEWSTTTGGVAPVINEDWFTEAPPKVTMTDGRSKKVRLVTFHELMTTHEPVSDGLEEVHQVVQVDLWAESRADVTQMRDEVKRILRANASSPVTGISWAFAGEWTDVTSMDSSDELYRLMTELELWYEEE
jgi:hypothetical protein